MKRTYESCLESLLLTGHNESGTISKFLFECIAFSQHLPVDFYSSSFPVIVHIFIVSEVRIQMKDIRRLYKATQ